MRWHTTRRILALAALGAIGAAVASVATISLVSVAAAGGEPAARAVFEVTHLPPLLTAPGEPRELVFEPHCLPAGVDDPEAGCDIEGTLFVREAGKGAYSSAPLEARGFGDGVLAARIPDALRSAPAIEYHAEFESAHVDGPVRVPPGGASAPSISRRLDAATTVVLGKHAFGSARRLGARAAFAAWGDDPGDAGLEARRDLDPIGASAFDVDGSGAILLLDHAHRRVLRWENGASRPTRVPVSINGTAADLAAAADGTFYVLETTSRDARAPLIRRFDGAGRELEAIEAAERGPAQIRMGPDGPLVLQRPSHQWMPISVAGVPVGPAMQRGRGRMGRTLRSGGEVVVLRHANELRVAIVDRERIARAWRITSETPLGEVQLAEPVGGHLVVVVRVYDDTSDEFAVLTLGPRVLTSRTTVATAGWAEAAALGRFRLVGRTLYRLGSSSAGVFVDRFDLEVR